jgi:hypothetical protein
MAHAVMNLDRHLRPRAQERAYGKPGKPGNPSRIAELAEAYVTCYGDLLEISARLRAEGIPEKHRGRKDGPDRPQAQRMLETHPHGLNSPVSGGRPNEGKAEKVLARSPVLAGQPLTRKSPIASWKPDHRLRAGSALSEDPALDRHDLCV